QLQSRAIDCFNDLLTQLKPILELDIREQKNHQLLPSLQTAHMLMVHILFTQKDVVSKADWLRLFPRSVTAAWNYDQLPAGDPTLLSILNGIKMMSRGDIARAVFATTVKTFATVDAKNTDEKQPIHRSHSMPMLSK
ncbi:MAG: hypothetical protein KDH94_04850, partial [Coxiellaceae bacterium]|nr:hypothetical protein [Coxiellaceae bacterium]